MPSGGVAVAGYYLYFFDIHNHVRRRLDLECRDDDHAIEAVNEHRHTMAMELWQGARMVKRFERSGD